MDLAVITVEEVLAAGSNLKAVTANRLAIPLYEGLRSQFTTIALSRHDQDIVRWWLKRERFSHWNTVISWPPEGFFSYEQWRVTMVKGFLADGFSVGFFVDSDLTVLSEVSKLGVACLGVSYPANSPGWQEQTAPRSWEMIVDTVEAQKEAGHAGSQ